jgi:polyphosphate kinase 2 (PPK2 family)
MLENVDLSRSLGKQTYKGLMPKLRQELWKLQRQALETGMPVTVVFEGWDAAGKGDSINRLAGWLDPRGLQVHPISAPLEDELLHPFLWRFWLKLPEAGRMAIFDRSWYGRVLIERIDKLCSRKEWRQAYEEINQFERQLTDDGMVIVKFWLHISKKEQKKRFKKIEKDPLLRWKVTDEDWKHHKQYKGYLQAAEEMLERTSTSNAPWTVVESTDRRYRRVNIYQTLCSAIQEGLMRHKQRKLADDLLRTQRTMPKPSPVEIPELQQVPTVLETVDLSKALSRADYERKLPKYQVRLRQLEFECHRHRLPVIIVYEGWDAAGKGGNIRRVTNHLEPRGYSVIPIAAPTGEETKHHYLWRFWKHIPKAGHLAIFDRSWYGRVLVERVEGLCTPEEWRSARQEIREFEQQLTNFGTVIVKLWLHIGSDEQSRRFEDRKNNEYKRYKLTDEDWRNREKWDIYREAVVDMLQYTSTTYAPWTIVEGNDKLWARIKTLHTICEAIERGLERKQGRVHIE